MNNINKLFDKYINKIIIIFLFIQPIIDIITAISINYFNINLTISSIIRLLFLGLCLYYLLFINKKNNRYIYLTFIYLFLFFILNIIYKDFSASLYEIHNALNTFYFPIVLMALINIFDDYKIKIKLKHIVIIYFIYIIFIIIPNLLNIGFISYYHSKLGQVGFFLSANAVGNILSILLPLIIYYLITTKNKIILKVLMIISIIYVFLSIGTKVPIASLIIVLLINFIHFFITWIIKHEYKKIITSIIIVITILVTSIIIIPKTNFYKNIEIHKNFLHIKHYREILTDYNLIDHFIFSQRLTFFNNTKNNYSQASIPEKLFGIGYIENYSTDKVNTKTIEIDYFDIIFRQGVIGTIVYIILLIKPIKLVLNVLKNKNILNLEFKISILLILLLSLFSGHILVTPAVSIYVALIICLILNQKELFK